MMFPRRQPIQSQKAGFTLLEVLMALALSVIVIGAIAMAIRLHLVTLNRQQTEIESKQVARSVIMMITNDIRASVQYRAQDFSALENLALSQQMIAGIAGAMQDDANPENNDAAEELGSAGGGSMPTGGDPTGGTPTGGASTGGGSPTGSGAPTAGNQPESESEESSMEDCASCRPTFIGTSTTISVDASRLPRIDEYNPLIAVQTDLVQTPTDIKSIAYFFDEVDPVIQPNNNFEVRSEIASGGLYRRQIDRAVAAYRGESGFAQVDENAQLIAPEVAEIRMRYFNGEQWVGDWDSEEEGGFPPAVEVELVIDPARAIEGRNYRYSGFDPETMQYYRTVIHLPSAELEAAE